MNKVPEGASTSVTKKRPISEAAAGTSPDITPTEAGDLALTKAGDGLDGGHRQKGGNVAKKSKISETTSPVLDVENLDHQSNPTKREYLVDKVNVTLKTYMDQKQKMLEEYKQKKENITTAVEQLMNDLDEQYIAIEAKFDEEMKKKMAEIENDNADIARGEERLKNLEQILRQFGFQYNGKPTVRVSATLGASKTDPTKYDPYQFSRPTKSGPTKSGPTKSGPTKSGPTKSGPTKSGPTKSGPAKPGPAKSGPAKSGPAKSGPAKSRTEESESVTNKTIN